MIKGGEWSYTFEADSLSPRRRLWSYSAVLNGILMRLSEAIDRYYAPTLGLLLDRERGSRACTAKMHSRRYRR